jgi:hypothetical protein
VKQVNSPVEARPEPHVRSRQEIGLSWWGGPPGLRGFSRTRSSASFVLAKSSAMLEQEPPRHTPMQRKIFWIAFTVLGLIAEFVLPIWWALGATIPIFCISWWVAYRSDWF